ncbi:N-acetyltransferase [Halomonas sp. ML-15]|uniref:GNAT family N-acetyltransferase n=1 Tax=Halomonas sp. ML-15 TaxID=2773305 RepID=UPI0017467CC1|nr:GNAT family N-acetyltransferase [Halomonas sp. ML-15]MBD3895013.1 N-acetyltransferase [Halomonas sp. ML-15]
MNIRHVVEDDFVEITEILNHYILHSDARYFEPAPVPLGGRQEWLNTFNQETPYQMLVAESDADVLGFCCSQKYRPEAAFNRTVEVSVYVSPKSASGGVGTKLYDELFTLLKKFQLHRALAGVALPNEASLALHQKFGFTEVGTFDEYGVKEGKYISSTWMQKKL